MKTFAIVVLAGLISWIALMVSIVFTEQALIKSEIEIEQLEERVANLESTLNMLTQLNSCI